MNTVPNMANKMEGVRSEQFAKTSDNFSNTVEANNLGLRTTENVSDHMSHLCALKKDTPRDVAPAPMNSAGGLSGDLLVGRKCSLAISELFCTLVEGFYQSLTSANQWLHTAIVWLSAKLKRVLSSTLFTAKEEEVANGQLKGSDCEILDHDATFMSLFQRSDGRHLYPQHNDFPRHLPYSSITTYAPYGQTSSCLGSNAGLSCVGADYSPNFWASNFDPQTQKRASKFIEEGPLSPNILANFDHSQQNLRFNYQTHPAVVNLTEGFQEPLLEFSEIQEIPPEIYSGKDWEWLAGTSDFSPFPALPNDPLSLEAINWVPSQMGLDLPSNMDGWDAATPDQTDLSELAQPVVALIIPEIAMPEGYKTLADVPTDLLEVIRDTFFEQVPGGYRKECCLMQFRTDKNFGTVQELSNLFSNYGDIDKVVYNQYLGAYLYCYMNPSGVELSEKYLRPLNMIGISFGLLAYPSEEQIASVFFPPKISSRFTKYASFNPKKRFSVRNDGIPVKPNRIGKCLHITYSGSDKSKTDLSTTVFQVISEVRTVKKTKVDAGPGKKNMWFAEFETIEDAVYVVMKCHNMKVGVGQLRLSFTKNL